MIRPLGSGAAGDVYLVENHEAGRVEALKVLKRAKTRDAEAIARGRFKREIHATQRLAHQNIVATYDYGELPDGRRFLTMEFVEGSSLHALLQHRGPLPIPIVLGILAELADALHHAHLAGVVHRDIKPHNLVLGDHPCGKIVRVLDFGMAKILDSSFEDSTVLSATGTMFGTPQYMAPEQWRCRPPDPRTDIYAVGCVAFELLLGEPPFRGAIGPLCAKHMQEPPRVPSTVDPDAQIPPDLDAIILRCLEKHVDRRFQTGGDLCAAIQTVSGYRPLRVPSPRS